MKRIIKFTGYILVLCLVLFVPVSAFAGCKEPKRGPPGPQGPIGPIGPSFVAAFGTWNIPGEIPTAVADGAIIPFSVNEVSQGITNAGGDFTLSNNGVYQLTCGIITQDNGFFEIELSGIPVSGGRIYPLLANGTINVITVMFAATAGQHVTVRNNSGATLNIGTGDPGSVGTYISILQIQ